MEMDTELNDFDEKQNDENSNSSSDSSEKVGCICAMLTVKLQGFIVGCCLHPLQF